MFGPKDMNLSVSAFLQGSTPVAVWGAALSTLLAVIKICEILKARIRVEVDYNFTSNENIGNEVIIRNLGATPIIATYWEIVWRKRKLFRWEQSFVIDPEQNTEDMKIGAHSSVTLSFREEQHFSTSPAVLAGRKIYLRMYLAGRTRPMEKKLYE